MVMHAYMLNPRGFLADCLRYGKMGFWTAGFPWDAAVNAIDNVSFEYQPTEGSRHRFESWTGRSWNNLDDPSTVSIMCPKCNSSFKAPWTTCDSKQAWPLVDTPGLGAGYAEADFAILCGCHLHITHNVLKVQKFRKDLQVLLKDQIPMPGTFMSVNGTILFFCPMPCHLAYLYCRSCGEEYEQFGSTLCFYVSKPIFRKWHEKSSARHHRRQK